MVLQHINEMMGFDLCLITRTQDGNQLILEAEDRSFGVKVGDVLDWNDSLCIRMVEGNAPHIAPDLQKSEFYRNVPSAEKFGFKAYFGFPLFSDDGELFGTVCGYHRNPLKESIINHEKTVDVLVKILNGLLRVELTLDKQERKAQYLELKVTFDQMTGIFNRTGWEASIAAEEKRCQRFGHSAGILIADLDNLKEINDTLGHPAGDKFLIETANVLKQEVREQDIAARLGGDEFGVLLTECDLAGALATAERLTKALEKANIAASIGLAMRQPDGHLHGAWIAADKKMYREKRQRKGD